MVTLDALSDTTQSRMDTMMNCNTLTEGGGGGVLKVRDLVGVVGWWILKDELKVILEIW